MAYRRRTRRTGYGRGRSYARRSFTKAKAGLNISTLFLAGLAVGYTNLDKMIPAEAVVGAAVVPIKGIGTVKAVAQGILFGNLVQSLVGNKGLSGTTAGGML